jgi:hypothetical protein
VASEESFVGTLPILSLLEDVDAYAGNVFDLTAKTIKHLQRMERLKSSRGELVEWRKLGEREVLLTRYLRCVEDFQKDLTNMRRADFAALSLIWESYDGQFLINCFH